MVNSWNVGDSLLANWTRLVPPPPPPPQVAPPPPPSFGADQFSMAPPEPRGAAGVASMGAAVQVVQSYQNPDALRQEIAGVLAVGQGTDLVGPIQVQRLQGYLAQMQPGQLESLKSLLNAAQTRVEQVFILKAFAANEPWPNLVQYAAEMRGRPEAEIVSRSTMRDERDLVQQWQDSCGPAMLQTAAGELDPRFAWELNKTLDLAALDPLGANAALAEQQKQWLETYGGRAVQRGQSGGTGIAIGQMLNDTLAPITGARYDTVPADDKRWALDQVANIVQGGLDVPIRLSWSQPGSGQDQGHFVLVMAVRGGAGGREFQIHDTWTGKTDWVSDAAILGDRMPPMFNDYARLTHIYPATLVA